PLDAGIIQCIKAHYRCAFCGRALDLDEAGERDIYKINLLEGMLMVTEAWNTIDSETIQNCWDHTEIQPEQRKTVELPIHADPGARDVLQNFAVSDMTLPMAEDQLRERLGDKYIDSDWQPALKAVMDAEGDVEAIRLLAERSNLPKLTIKLPSQCTTAAKQIKAAEDALMESVNELVKKKRIFGEPLSLEELVDPIEEREDPDSSYTFDSGEAEIISQVWREMAEKGAIDVIEIDDLDDEDNDPDGDVPCAEVITLCKKLERLCVRYGDSDLPLELPRQLRKFRAQLHRKQMADSKQSHLERYFG
ncbi:hypothetical protein C0995_009563, partial [Termitomyces sp. Mi166